MKRGPLGVASGPDSGLVALDWVAETAREDAVEGIRRELGCSRTLARLLAVRGIEDPLDAERFLNPSLQGLSSPLKLKDMDRAVERVRGALSRGERIAIYGDYDVDGVSASALLTEMFRHLGADLITYIPHRIEEGYGLNGGAIQKLAEEGVQLLITVDGGANAREELALARRLGLDVIVTDHHPLDGPLPDVPLIHPDRPDDPHPELGLSGVGVAYKFVWALGMSLSGGARVSDSYRDFMLSALAYVALGTVADVVPLRGENRILVHYGLRALRESSHAGLRALLDAARLSSGSVDAEAVAFRIAPLLNAAGRVGHAEDALALLLEKDPEQARRRCADLVRLNEERRDIERRMLAECEAQIEESRLLEAPGAVVVGGEGWHAGVAGIVASRLVEKVDRPVFVAAFRDGLGRGSARSLPGVSLVPFYEAARGHVDAVGGHAQAGGVTLARERLEAFRDALRGIPGAFPARSLSYDLSLPADEIRLGLLSELARLEPHGAGNPPPSVRLDSLQLAGSPRLIGKGEDHLAFQLRRSGPPLRVVCFRGASWARRLRNTARPFSLLGRVVRNDFGGESQAEIHALDLRVHSPPPPGR